MNSIMRSHDHNVNYTSLLHQHTVYKQTTLTLSTTHQKAITIMATNPVTTEPAITGCTTYDCLDKRLRQSYTNYKKLSKDGEIAGFYKYSCSTDPLYISHPRYDDEIKPGDHTSDYLRGGVISTVATFEAFIGDLINEATDLIAAENTNKQKLEDIN